MHRSLLLVCGPASGLGTRSGGNPPRGVQTSPPQLLINRVAFLLRLESGALDSLHLIWERLLYRPVGSAQRAPVAARPDAMNSQRQVKKILVPANPPHSLPTAHYGPRGGRHSRWPYTYISSHKAQAECTTPFLAHKSFTHSCGIGIPLERKSIATHALPLETCLRSG